MKTEKAVIIYALACVVALMIIGFMPMKCRAQTIDDNYQIGKNWGNINTIMELSYITLFFIDFRQSCHMSEHNWNQPIKNRNGETYSERNPILGKSPSKKELFEYMLICDTIHFTISYLLPNPQRKIWQGMTIFVAGYSGVYRNYKQGLSYKLAWKQEL
jgi:hypothetical protein